MAYVLDSASIGSPNMRLPSATPIMAPLTSTTAYARASDQESPPCEASANVTAGLNCLVPVLVRRARLRLLARLHVGAAWKAEPRKCVVVSCDGSVWVGQRTD